MPFRYLRDPLCITAFALYWLNRFLVKPFTDATFIHHHFNDLICIPLFVPFVVLAARLCRFREHDQPPQIHEILLPLLVWSIMFELLLPKHPFWSRYVVGDPFDILWYTVGACIASTWWRHYYTPPVADNGV